MTEAEPANEPPTTDDVRAVLAGPYSCAHPPEVIIFNTKRGATNGVRRSN